MYSYLKTKFWLGFFHSVWILASKAAGCCHRLCTPRPVLVEKERSQCGQHNWATTISKGGSSCPAVNTEPRSTLVGRAVWMRLPLSLFCLVLVPTVKTQWGQQPQRAMIARTSVSLPKQLPTLTPRQWRLTWDREVRCRQGKNQATLQAVRCIIPLREWYSFSFQIGIMKIKNIQKILNLCK